MEASPERPANFRQARYEASRRALEFELDLFWKRSLFFWGFIAAAFIAFTANHSSPRLQTAIASFGFVCSIVWTLVNRGGKFWYENWEEKLKEAELDITGPLYGNPIREKKPVGLEEGWLIGRRYSLSKLAIALSDYVALLWLGLLIEKSAMLLSEGLELWGILRLPLEMRDWFTLTFVVASLYYAFLLFSVCHSKD